MRRLVPTFIAFFILTAPAQAAWLWPVSGEVITPYRNGTDPYATGQHRGIDIAAPAGTPVRAAAAGDVRFAGTAGSSGLTIGIRTSDGYDTSYLHLSALDVRAGARVAAGDRIGAVGTTGSRSAAAPHLHFGVRDAGTRHAYHDPLGLLPPAPPASPTPEPPAPVPAPSPESSPPPPSPIPAPVPQMTPLPADAPVPRAAPRPSRHRLPSPASSTRRALGVRRSPHPASSVPPRLDPTPKDARRNRAKPEIKTSGAASDRPEAIASARGPLRTGPVPAYSAAPGGRARGDAGSGGPDIGLVLACAGLLLAAGVLGLSEDGRRATTRTRSKLLAALPALGRR